MDHGRVEQLGTPEELYDAPRTLFVAGFIGTTNLLPGTVESVGRRARPSSGSTAGERCLAARGRRATAGDAVDVAIRPEAIRPRGRRAHGRAAGAATAARPTLDGEVLQSAYLGVSISHQVRTTAGVTLTVVVPRSHERPGIGDAVRVELARRRRDGASPPRGGGAGGGDPMSELHRSDTAAPPDDAADRAPRHGRPGRGRRHGRPRRRLRRVRRQRGAVDRARAHAGPRRPRRRRTPRPRRRRPSPRPPPRPRASSTSTTGPTTSARTRSPRSRTSTAIKVTYDFFDNDEHDAGQGRAPGTAATT